MPPKNITGLALLGALTSSTLFLSAVAYADDAAERSATLSPEPNQINGAMEWESENSYWQKHYLTAPYYKSDTEYGLYKPAYRYGEDAYTTYHGQAYEDIRESDLRNGWEKLKDKSKLTWEEVKDAVHEGYKRMQDKYASQPSQ